MQITLIGGPTALLEIDGLRLLTDPTFDAAGSELTNGAVTLHKTEGPAIPVFQLGRIDAVLLSHDQHFDNLDHSGREFLSLAGSVFTTEAGASRLGGNTVGLAPWRSAAITSADDATTRLHITATPARHGPPGIEPISGEVAGFVLRSEDAPNAAVYITGDTVWYEGVAEVAQRFAVKAVVLFAGAARVQARGPEHLTMDVEDALATARAFPEAAIFPVHHRGWKHFSESQQDLVRSFAEHGLSSQLYPLEPGVPRSLSLI
jgi:L-ascorbate metabolism protein UlaG (beta-lactamase superfamily)